MAMAMLAAHGEVLGKEYHNGSVTVHCRLPARHFGKLVGPEVTIRPHANGNGALTLPTAAEGE